MKIMMHDYILLGKHRKDNIVNNQVVDLGSIDMPLLHQVTNTMTSLDIDEKMLERVLEAVTEGAKEKNQPVVNNQTMPSQPQQHKSLKGKGTFKRFSPKSFAQVVESEDGSLAVTIETRDWEMRGQSGTSTKIHVRTKYLDKQGQIVYGNDIASFKNVENVQAVLKLLQKSLQTLK